MKLEDVVTSVHLQTGLTTEDYEEAPVNAL